MKNPYTGFQAPGFRFRFHVRSIAHRSLFLPTEMKNLPEIIRLRQGESPLTVFNRQDIKSARSAFCDLRKKFDFAYWAVRDYHIRDMQNPHNITTLYLNNFQHYLIDVIQRRSSKRLDGKYLITKTFGSCGVTTCVQAYILWFQTFKSPKHSLTCSDSDLNMEPIKENLFRFANQDSSLIAKSVSIPSTGKSAYFGTCRNPMQVPEKDFAFVHFADMHRWYDDGSDPTSKLCDTVTRSLVQHKDSLLIMEGNIPSPKEFRMEEYQDRQMPQKLRIMRLEHLFSNPTFLDYVAMANHPHIKIAFTHINLDYTFTKSRRLSIQ